MKICIYIIMWVQNYKFLSILNNIIEKYALTLCDIKNFIMPQHLRQN